MLDRLVDGFGSGPCRREGLGLESLFAPGLLARSLIESLLALVLVGSTSILRGLVAPGGLSQRILPGKAAVYRLGMASSWMPLVPSLVEQIVQVLALVVGATGLEHGLDLLVQVLQIGIIVFQSLQYPRLRGQRPEAIDVVDHSENWLRTKALIQLLWLRVHNLALQQLFSGLLLHGPILLPRVVFVEGKSTQPKF